MERPICLHHSPCHGFVTICVCLPPAAQHGGYPRGRSRPNPCPKLLPGGVQRHPSLLPSVHLHHLPLHPVRLLPAQLPGLGGHLQGEGEQYGFPCCHVCLRLYASCNFVILPAQVGWTTTKDYHTFVWVDLGSDVAGEQSMTNHSVFKGRMIFVMNTARVSPLNSSSLISM